MWDSNAASSVVIPASRSWLSAVKCSSTILTMGAWRSVGISAIGSRFQSSGADVDVASAVCSQIIAGDA